MQYNIRYLLDHGHTILNLDQVIFDNPRVVIRIANITKAGEIYDVMSGYANYSELASGTGAPSFDALVHFQPSPDYFTRTTINIIG